MVEEEEEQQQQQSVLKLWDRHVSKSGIFVCVHFSSVQHCLKLSVLRGGCLCPSEDMVFSRAVNQLID